MLAASRAAGDEQLHFREPAQDGGQGRRFGTLPTMAVPARVGTAILTSDAARRRWARHRPCRPRFIPARAGNTRRRRPASRSWSVHPRSRGEHWRSDAETIPGVGSSPLARGTPGGHPARISEQRFIPARAGNTSGSPPRSPPPPVHPRSRGEHPMGRPGAYVLCGSSPLARGTRHTCVRYGPLPRFIPARAGNTTPRRPRCCARPVHPRSRGEHSSRSMTSSQSSGSSPLARGTPCPLLPAFERPRFIPARAGNTRCPRTRAEWTAVHPRSRGEHFFAVFFAGGVFGSSPLARGTPVGAGVCHV